MLSIFAFAGCSDAVGRTSDAPDASTASVGAATPASRPLSETTAAHVRIDSLRSRFTIVPPELPRHPSDTRAVAPTPPRAVIGASGVERFEVAGDRVRAVVSPTARRGVTHATSVELPTTAAGEIAIEDDTHVAVRFALVGARSSTIETADGIAIYRGAFDGADVVHRVHSEGTEDYVIFDAKPTREELAYRVDVSRVAGLRLVSNVAEFLDAAGTPRLRIAPPYVVDARGARHEAKLAIDGCAYDADPRAPWGRGVTAPGASSCLVRVAWSGVAYPALVDPVWSAAGSMASARQWHTASVLSSGKVLVVGGNGPGVLASAELYDPSSNTFSAAGSMASARELHTASLLPSGKILVTGGEGSSGGVSPVASAELYDPSTNTFSGAGPMATARYYHTASVLPSGKVLITGGYNLSGVPANAELYDPSSNAFSAAGSMASGRYNHTASVLLSGKVLVAGGQAGGGLASAELYDPSSNAFSAAGSMASGRYDHTASVLLSGKVLVAGGTGVGSQASAELYDPSSNAFSAAGSMASGHSDHTASVLSSGKVLVAGGDASGGLASAEVYDPNSNTFSGADSLASRRYYHTASVLSSGKVLVAGGADGASVLASAELFAAYGNGAACADGGECVSGFCTDGVCCNTACAGACDVCAKTLGASADGTCTNAPAGDPGSPACTPYVCNGTSATCAATCSTDASCVAGDWCKSGSCVAKSTSGAACPTGPHECATDFCVDGYCCGAACTSQCEACDVPGSLGSCVTISGAPHPSHAACPGAGVCAALCDGSNPGACSAFPGLTTQCAFATCASGSATSTGYCDGAGDCSVPAATSCAPFTCGASACKTTCSASTDCIAGYTCKSGACVPNTGVACTVAGDCISGFCVDGFCCDSACTGQCEACNIGGREGTCTPVVGAPQGTRKACDGTGACAAECDGTNRAQCGLPPGATTPCAAARCDATAGKAYATAYCDGLGDCAPPSSTSCGGYLCNGVACGTTCVTASDCVSGWTCTGGTCVPKTGNACKTASDCTSGFCADGYCCDLACKGQCEACDVAGSEGVCSPVAGQPHGTRSACSDGAGNACAATSCDNNNRTNCAAFASATTTCAPAACASNTLTHEATCDGAGSCKTPTTSSCSPYHCADATKCATSCTTNTDCATGFFCASGACSAITATCSGDDTQSIPQDGSGAKSCAPYLCDPSTGNCFPQCAASSQCAAGDVCDVAG
ncbi:MAG: kelch repeat-containing protein, partial [Polyangiales bacterium]